MPIGRPIPTLHLSNDERETMERWPRRRKTAQVLVFRARLILACAEGKKNGDVATALLMTRPIVGKWRTRFIGPRFDGLLDEPRPGAPGQISKYGCGAGDHRNPGVDFERNYGLEHPFHGEGVWIDPEWGQSDLDSIRLAALSHRLNQHGRALVCRLDRKTITSRRFSECSGA